MAIIVVMICSCISRFISNYRNESDDANADYYQYILLKKLWKLVDEGIFFLLDEIEDED